MRYELTDYEWAAVRLFLPNKPRGVPRVNDRRVLNGLAVRRRAVRRSRWLAEPSPKLWPVQRTR